MPVSGLSGFVISDQTAVLTEGDAGTEQYDPSIGMTPSGSFVEVWTQADRLNSKVESGIKTNVAGIDTLAQFINGIPQTTIRYREFQESSDTAGPSIAGVFSASGAALTGNVTSPSTLKHIVLVCDEDMLMYSSTLVTWARSQRDLYIAKGQPVPQDVIHILDSVTNVDNYELLKNGTRLSTLTNGKMSNTIVSVDYGMNAASDLAASDPTRYADLASAPARNRYEIVLTLAEPITGNVDTYTIEAAAPRILNGQSISGLRDKAGNPLARTGFKPNGEDFTQKFLLSVTNAVLPPGVLTPGNPGAPGAPAANAQDIAVSLATAGKQDSVAIATDAMGNHVTVWVTYDAQGNGDIMARRYNQYGQPQGAAFVVNDYKVGNQSQPAVAMTAGGDFRDRLVRRDSDRCQGH